MNKNALLGLLSLVPCAAHAQLDAQLEEVEVTGRTVNLVGSASSASQGLVGRAVESLQPGGELE